MSDIFFVDKTPSVSNVHDDDDDDADELAALEEEKRLEALVFDDPEEILENIAQDSNTQDFPKSFSHAILDRLGNTKSKRKTKQLQPVWVDDQEEELTVDLSKSKTKKLKRSVDETQIDVREYENRLRALKEKTAYQSLDWAQLSDTNVTGADILQTNRSFTSKSTSLQPHKLSFVKVNNANSESPFEKAIKCLNFHPKSQLLLVASSGQTQLRLFNVDGAKNSLVQSLSIEKFSVRKAVFSPNGNEVFAISSKSSLCYVYDIQANSMRPITGSPDRSNPWDVHFSPDNQLIAITSINTGQLDLLSDKSKRRIHTIKVSGNIVASTFSPDNKYIYCASDDRNIYVFDLKSRRCVHKFADEGSLGNTCLSFSHDGSLLAIGSSSGIVNVYDTKSIEGTSSPVPVSTIMNLKTAISQVMFNSTSEILAIQSAESLNAMRLVHTASWTTFRNWPPPSKLKYKCFDISPNSGYICLGTTFGEVPLYRLLHYCST